MVRVAHSRERDPRSSHLVSHPPHLGTGARHLLALDAMEHERHVGGMDGPEFAAVCRGWKLQNVHVRRRALRRRLSVREDVCVAASSAIREHFAEQVA